jgi:hypothetical protein
MSEPRWIRVYRIAFALLAIVAIVEKFDQDNDPWNIFLSKFTYQTNAFIAMVFFGGAFLVPKIIASVRWDKVRGAAVMYMVTLFVVYGFLVNSFDNPFNTTRHWTHTVLHQIIPVAVVLDVMLRPLANRLPWRAALVWAIYPIIYLAWSVVRGQIDGWYPYGFIDPAEAGGWEGVAINVVGISAGFIALGLIIVWVSQWYHRRAAAMAPSKHLPTARRR